MAFSRIQSTSIPFPSDWELPYFDLGEWIIAFPGAYHHPRIGQIVGLEYIFKEEQYGKGTDVDLGWHYNILIDRNDPFYKSDPVVIVHETYLIKCPPYWRLVTFPGVIEPAVRQHSTTLQTNPKA